MTNIEVVGTEKFFKRKAPSLKPMELIAMQGFNEPTTARIFLREISDSDNPSRIMAQLTAAQCERFAEELLNIAKSCREAQPSVITQP